MKKDYIEDIDTQIVDIGNQFRELRIEQGLSQAKLASLVGTQQAVISRLERGNHVPTLTNLYKIAFALGAKVKVSLKSRNS